MRIKQCVVYPLYKQDGISVDDFCAEIAEIGFAALEFFGRDEEFEELMESTRRHGLKVASMTGHGSLGDGLNREENHDRIEAELRESIDVAADYGVPGLICFSGTRNPGQSDLEGMMTCAGGLRRIAPYAEQKGVNLNMELLNSKVNHPGYQCDHTDWGLAMCEMVNSPRVKLLYDIYHMQIMEGDVIRNIRRAIGRIGHFHTAGNPGRHDMDETQELNYPGICRAVAATGYDLYVGHEFGPKGDPMEALRRAFEICDQG